MKWLCVGSIPGAFSGLVRRALAFVLLASALKLFGVPDTETGITLLTTLLVAPVLWMLVRRRMGYPALARWGLPKQAVQKVGGSASPDGDPT